MNMGRPEVLIVEDEMLVALDLELIVAETVPATVKIATTVDEAQAVAGPDLRFAFLDMHVTNGTTFDIARRLLSQHVKVAFVSGSDPTTVPAALRAVPFIRKPYRRDEIRKALLAAMGDGPWPAAA
jgi:DNA-binding LytR/AlgR family response regulator